MRIKLSELRRIIYEAVRDTMIAHTEVPPNSGRAYYGPESIPSARGDLVNDKATMVIKLIGLEHAKEIQQFVAAMDPEARLLKTAQQIAQEFLSFNK